MASAVRVGVGVDIGGTSIKFGLVTESGEVLAKRAIPLDKSTPFARFATELGDEIAALLADGPAPVAIGVGVPAYPNPKTGGLMKSIPNAPPLTGGSLRDEFTARFGLPTVIGNDGVCATEGEMVWGAGRPFQRFAVLTLGTGIGGAVVIDRKIIDGPNGLPPEIGAICLDPSRTDLPGPIPGTFEFLASASALLRRYQALTGDVGITTTQEVYDRAKAGDATALQVVHEGGRWIAQAIGMMSNMLNLEAVILGGGLSGAGEFLLDTVRPYLKGFYWALFERPPLLLLAETGNDAGIIGAAAIGLAGRPVS
ncbi:ROK family protein [Acidisoma cellulosilytica]|uniref:ROK family protein n=1 Tax=Acidisoma cellulosilyticum TaxID=2802395 RepID=A0A963Z2E7_9PROT|nr:ROK family protein [Acidisoma cellulosilyticum]MCB8881361.1 ROK family protein [Acidisoma cellulosilyticum]